MFMAVSAGASPGVWLCGIGISMDRVQGTARVIWGLGYLSNFAGPETRRSHGTRADVQIPPPEDSIWAAENGAPKSILFKKDPR